MKKIIYQFKNKEVSEWSIFSPINGAGGNYIYSRIYKCKSR